MKAVVVVGRGKGVVLESGNENIYVQLKKKKSCKVNILEIPWHYYCLSRKGSIKPAPRPFLLP